MLVAGRMMKKDQQKLQTEEVQRQTRDLLGEHSDALEIFDSLPKAKGEAADWEESMSGPNAPFPSTIEEIDHTEVVAQSENGSKFVKAIKGLLKGKK